MFKVDFLTFNKLLKTEKKALFVLETKSGYELFTSDGIWKFSTFVAKNDTFDSEFKSEFMKDAIKVEDVSRVKMTIE